jgi:rhamnose utilization protein RhaD (predicted bifunctional aldolase and dehydrogenase)
MPGPWDASVKLLSAVDTGTTDSIDEIANGDPFDVLADVEIGENLNEHVDDFVLRVAIRNLTQSTTVQTITQTGTLTPVDDTTFTNQERVIFNAPGQTVGDVLQAVASYRVNAGSNTDFSAAESNIFVVA